MENFIFIYFYFYNIYPFKCQNMLTIPLIYKYVKNPLKFKFLTWYANLIFAIALASSSGFSAGSALNNYIIQQYNT